MYYHHPIPLLPMLPHLPMPHQTIRHPFVNCKRHNPQSWQKRQQMRLSIYSFSYLSLNFILLINEIFISLCEAANIRLARLQTIHYLCCRYLLLIWWNIREWTDESPCRENRMRMASATLFLYLSLVGRTRHDDTQGESAVLQ